MSRCLFIDATNRTIIATEYSENGGVQKLLGGSIEAAYQWPSGDVLYVDEAGLLKPQRGFFTIDARPDQPLPGNGVIVGREVEDRSPAGFHTAPPAMTVETLTKAVQFRDRAWVDAWGRANASEPAAWMTALDAGGKPLTDTLYTFGSLIREMPRPTPEPVGYAIDADDFRKLRRIERELQGGSDRERDFGHRIWLILNEIEGQPFGMGEDNA